MSGKHTVKKVKIVIAEGKVLMEGIKSLLSTTDDLEVAGEAADGLELIRCMEKHQPEVLLFGWDATSMIRDLKSRFPKTKIIVLTSHLTDDHIRKFFQSGAEGYFALNWKCTDLLVAIRSVLDGKRYLSPSHSL